MIVLITSETGNQRLRDGYTQVIRSQQVQRDISTLLGELVNAEAGQRGYLLTGKEGYLDPYYRALPHITQLMAQIRAHYADDPEALAVRRDLATDRPQAQRDGPHPGLWQA